jgi:tellurite resistance protein TerC
VLAYVGVKMMLSHHHPIPNLVSLAVIGGILSVGVLSSMVAVSDTARLVSPLADDLERLAVTSYREARRIVILVVGLTVVLIGIALLVLPGPGSIAIFLGLTILAIEFAWARRWLTWLKTTTDDARQSVSKWMRPKDTE